MFAIFDHLQSLLIAGAVILILAGAQYTMTKSAVDATGYYVGRASSRALITALDDDLPNVGAEVPAATAAFVAFDRQATQRVLEFRGRVAGAAAVQRVRYVATRYTGAACAGVASPCWEVRRAAYPDGGAATAPARLGTVADFDVQLLPEGATLATATAVEVHLTAAPPAGADGAVGLQTWTRRYRLPNLTLRTSS